MRQIKDQNLAQLLMQFRFIPQKHRRKQLDAAEQLLTAIDADKEYPFDFVCFRITGYHPKRLADQPLIKGSELSDDLRIFISKLSGRLARPVSQEKEKVYDIEQLAEACGVSTKTVHRWRKRGLLCRKFIFDDGIKRFGFLQSAVDRFFSKNPNLVSKAKAFGRLTDKDKQSIIKQARTLGARTNTSRHQIIKRIAEQTGRAHETIRYTIAAYEKVNPGRALFRKPAGVINPSEAAEIYRLFKQGTAIEELMDHFNRSKSSIYRLINLQRAKMVLARKIEYITSDEFFEEGAKEKILANPLDADTVSSRPTTRSFEPADDSLLPEYLQTLKNAPVFGRERELELFRRYNYVKYLAYVTRAQISLSRVSSTRLKQVENYLAEAETIKKMIIEANLRLVVGTAVKHTITGANLSDLVSEGNFALMRAVERFDYTKGFRFSSHASWAITKDLARKVPAESALAGKSRSTDFAGVHRDLRRTAAADLGAVDRAHRSLTQVIKDNLNEREQYVILHHFGLLGPPVKKEKKTLKQIGEDLGLSKERVRQIELVALQKLRHSLSPEQFELLTG